MLNPQLDENIGSVARAMLNFDFYNLRIVKEKWKPNKTSINMSAGAESILKNAKIYCIAICHTVNSSDLSEANEIVKSIDQIKHTKTFQKLIQ